MERKTLSQSILGILIVGYSLVVCSVAIVNGTSIMGAAGIITAAMLFSRRYLTSESTNKLSGLYLAISVLAVILSSIVSVFHGGNIVFTMLDALCTLALTVSAIVICRNKVNFIENCSKGQFIITMIVCLLIIPSLLFMMSGMIKLLIALILIIVLIAIIINIFKK